MIKLHTFISGYFIIKIYSEDWYDVKSALHALGHGQMTTCNMNFGGNKDVSYDRQL